MFFVAIHMALTAWKSHEHRLAFRDSRAQGDATRGFGKIGDVWRTS